MSKKSRFKGPFNKQHGKRAQTLFKSGREHLYDIYWSLQKQLSWEQSLLVIFKILGLFVNILTAEDEYSLLNRDNLMEPIRMQLSQKQKNFHNFLLQFRIVD